MKATLTNGAEFSIMWKHWTKSNIPGTFTQGTICFITPSSNDKKKFEELMEDAINDKVINGVALCNPMDNFDREKGRKLSLTRALNAWGLEKADRTIIWKAYASMCNKSW